MSFIKNRFIPCTLTQTEIRLYEYTVIGKIIYPSASAEDILGIDFLANLNGPGSYNIQIVDKTKNNLITEQTFSNENEVIQSFERIEYQPRATSIVEVSAKLNDGKASALNIYDLKMWCH